MRMRSNHHLADCQTRRIAWGPQSAQPVARPDLRTDGRFARQLLQLHQWPTASTRTAGTGAAAAYPARSPRADLTRLLARTTSVSSNTGGSAQCQVIQAVRARCPATPAAQARRRREVPLAIPAAQAQRPATPAVQVQRLATPAVQARRPAMWVAQARRRPEVRLAKPALSSSASSNTGGSISTLGKTGGSISLLGGTSGSAGALAAAGDRAAAHRLPAVAHRPAARAAAPGAVEGRPRPAHWRPRFAIPRPRSPSRVPQDTRWKATTPTGS